MLTATLLLTLCAATGTSETSVPTPAPEQPLSLTESLLIQGAPSMMDMHPQTFTQAPPAGMRPRWMPGQTLMQGYFGALIVEQADTSGGGIPDTENSDSTMPTLGGGAQYKIGGGRVDWGFEGMIGFSGRADASAFYFGGSGAAVAVDVDLLLFDLYAGPFVSMFLGEKVRIYGAAGPIMQWANYDQQGTTIADSGSGSGFGLGGYARTGVEFIVSSGTMIGLGARWSQTEIDLSGNVGNLDVSGLQAVLTVTTGL